MSDPDAPRPEPDPPELYLPDPPKKSGLQTVAKLLLLLLALGAGLVVLVFGTCLLMFSR
jgi:hypothetical protein